MPRASRGLSGGALEVGEHAYHRRDERADELQLLSCARLHRVTVRMLMGTWTFADDGNIYGSHGGELWQVHRLAPTLE